MSTGATVAVVVGGVAVAGGIAAIMIHRSRQQAAGTAPAPSPIVKRSVGQQVGDILARLGGRALAAGASVAEKGATEFIDNATGKLLTKVG